MGGNGWSWYTRSQTWEGYYIGIEYWILIYTVYGKFNSFNSLRKHCWKNQAQRTSPHLSALRRGAGVRLGLNDYPNRQPCLTLPHMSMRMHRHGRYCRYRTTHWNPSVQNRVPVSAVCTLGVWNVGVHTYPYLMIQPRSPNFVERSTSMQIGIPLSVPMQVVASPPKK